MDGNVIGVCCLIVWIQDCRFCMQIVRWKQDDFPETKVNVLAADSRKFQCRFNGDSVWNLKEKSAEAEKNRRVIRARIPNKINLDPFQFLGIHFSRYAKVSVGYKMKFVKINTAISKIVHSV